MAVVESLAARVVADHGGDLRRMRRALGMSNATWVGGGLAVRIAKRPLVGAMAAEVALVRALPVEVGHPTILGTGTIDGHDWIVTEEVRGENLREAWPTLMPEQRRGAVGQLWDRARAVHAATPSLRSLVGSHAGFVVTPGEATAAAGRVSAALDLNAGQRSRLHEIIGAYFGAAPVAEQVVNHGDLALMNAVWDGEVVALLDFEFAMLGPVEIDLCRLVAEAVVCDGGDDSDPSGAAAAAFAIAARDRDPVHGRTLLLGAAVLDQLRDLELWLATDERSQDWRPDRLLTGLLDPDGGYLAPALID